MIQLLGPSFWATTVGVTGGIGDTFDRADSAVSLGTASDGAVWTAADTWGISSNKGYSPVSSGTGPSGVTIAYRNGSASTTYTEACDITTSTEKPGLIFRVQDATNFFLAELDTGGLVRLYKCTAGSFSLFNTASAGYATGDTVNLSVKSDGSSGDITIKVNGTTYIIATAEASFIGETKIGLCTAIPVASATGRYDNLTVT